MQDNTTEATGKKVLPLESSIDVNNLTDCAFQASFDSSDVYLNDDGALVVDLKIWDCEFYDMVDISMLQVGDIIVINQEEVIIESLENSDGEVMINGGIDEDGYTLMTEDTGVYFAVGFNDAKTYFKVGEATVKVGQEFVYTDYPQDPQADASVYYAGDFLMKMQDETDSFLPDNTTAIMEEGWLVSVDRTYMP